MLTLFFVRFYDLTEDEKEAIAKEVRDTGALRKDVLRKHGVTGQKKVKAFMKRQTFSELTEEEKRAMMREVEETNLPTSVIGRKYGIAGSALRRMMKENGKEPSFKRKAELIR